jgi:hypothetical protein
MSIAFDITVNGKKTSGGVLNSDDIKKINKFIKTKHIDIADVALIEEQKLGFDKKPRVRVDNKWDVPEEQVKPFGKIEYYSRIDIGEALLYAYKAISGRSPIVSGTFSVANYVYHNRQLVAKDIFGLASWLKKADLRDGSNVRFVNVTPYASRLELRGMRGSKSGNIFKSKWSKHKKGRNGGRLYQVRQPNGVYMLAARAVRRKFKVAEKVLKFEWVGGSSGIRIPSTVNGKTFRTTYHPLNKKRKGSHYIYPSIKFIISSRGIIQ